MSGNPPIMKISPPSDDLPLGPRGNLDQLAENQFYEDFSKYREITEIIINGYEIRKERFKEYAVFIYFSLKKIFKGLF